MENIDEKITIDEVLENWNKYYLEYFVDILNKEYPLDTAIEDIKSFRKKVEK